MRGIAFIVHFGVVGGIASTGAFDSRRDLVLGHVDGARILQDAPQRRVGRRVGAAGLDRHGNVFGDARELLGHAVPARKHGVFPNFKDATHDFLILPGGYG